MDLNSHQPNLSGDSCSHPGCCPDHRPPHPGRRFSSSCTELALEEPRPELLAGHLEHHPHSPVRVLFNKCPWENVQAKGVNSHVQLTSSKLADLRLDGQPLALLDVHLSGFQSIFLCKPPCSLSKNLLLVCPRVGHLDPRL